MQIPCLLCRENLEPFHVFPKKALFTKPLKSAQPAAVADMHIAFCPQCRHISSHLDTSFSKEQLSRITYEELYENFVPTDLSPSQKSFTEFVGRWLQRSIPARSRVLEIGSHDGYLLHLIQKQGHTCEGVEPSPFADFSREKYGLSVIKDFFRAEQFEPESFDVVILRHVIEHLHEPAVLLEEALRSLKIGGLLYVEVPNSYSSLSECFFPEFHADHISYFTMPSMAHLLAECGLSEIVHQESVIAYMKFPFISALARKGEKRMAAKEAGWFLDFRMPELIRSFKTSYATYLKNLRALREAGSLAVWGTGSIGIQYAIDAGWGADEVTYVDINPKNQGLFLSVTGQKVQSPETLKKNPPDTFLIASGWEHDVRQQATKFVGGAGRVLGYSDLLRP